MNDYGTIQGLLEARRLDALREDRAAARRHSLDEARWADAPSLVRLPTLDLGRVLTAFGLRTPAPTPVRCECAA